MKIKDTVRGPLSTYLAEKSHGASNMWSSTESLTLTNKTHEILTFLY